MKICLHYLLRLLLFVMPYLAYQVIVILVIVNTKGTYLSFPISSEEVCNEVDPRTSTDEGEVSTSTDPNEPLCLNLATDEDVDIDAVLSESGVEEPNTSQLSEDLQKEI